MTTPIAQIETLDGLQTLTQFAGPADGDRRCIELGSVRLNRPQALRFALRLLEWVIERGEP